MMMWYLFWALVSLAVCGATWAWLMRAKNLALVIILLAVLGGGIISFLGYMQVLIAVLWHYITG